MNLRLNSTQEERFFSNQRLVYYLLKKNGISRCDYEYEDLASSGTLGLLKAALTYDETKNIKFATYACKCINNEIYMFLRKESKHKNNCTSLEKIISSDSKGRGLKLEDIVFSSKQDFTEKIESIEEFESIINVILNTLSKTERAFLLYKIAGKTQKYIAEKFDFSQSYVSKIENDCSKKLKSYIKSKKKYEKKYELKKVDDLYQFTIYIKNNELIEEQFLKELKDVKKNKEVDFKMKINNNKCVIYLIANFELFIFLEKIIKEFENCI